MASLDTLDPSKPPFIPVEGLANLRDIGGYPVSSPSPSKVVRPRIFYRAADPCKCRDASIRKLRDELGITTIYDIRAKPEMDKNVGTESDVAEWDQRLSEVSSDGKGTIQREWTPVFKEEDYGPDQVAVRYKDYADRGPEGFVRAYSAIAEHGVSSFTRMFKQIAAIDPARPNQGILIHCTAGKDRTGVFVALLLSLLGVDDQTIAKEYTLTEVGLREQKPHFIERIMASPAFQEPGGLGREGALRMTTCTQEKMLETLKMIQREYGGAEGYVKSKCGLSNEEVERIRKVMIVDGDSKPAL